MVRATIEEVQFDETGRQKASAFTKSIWFLESDHGYIKVDVCVRLYVGI